MQERNKAVGWVMLQLPPNSLGLHLLKTTRQGEGRATREPKKEGKEPEVGEGRRKGAQS